MINLVGSMCRFFNMWTLSFKQSWQFLVPKDFCTESGFPLEVSTDTNFQSVKFNRF